MRSLIILFVAGGWLLGDCILWQQAWANKPPPRQRRQRDTKKPSPQTAETEQDRTLRREAAQELLRWLAPLSPKHRSQQGLRSVMQWLRTWIASRWGLRLDPKAWDRWTRMTRRIGTWQPAPLYRDIRFKRLHPRLFAKLKGMKFKMTAPKPQQKWNGDVGSGKFKFKLVPLKRRRAKDRRPYLFLLNSSTRILPIRARQLDNVLLFILRRFTDPQLNIPLTTQQKQYLDSMPSGHSRRIARWINSRVPHTAALIRRYLKVISILEPIGNGLYKLDLRARWRLKPFKKDYPRAAKLLLREKTDFAIVTEFRDARKRLWFTWSYHRKHMEQRYQAVISKDGFWFCDDKWKPIAGPWRPTQMDTTWDTITRVRYRSNNLRFVVKRIALKWSVRGTPQGAILAAEMDRTPQLNIQGGQFIRLLARILISGGISGLIRRFLYNLAHGDQGRGLRWHWELVESKQKATIHFNITMPIVPDSTLTTLLRLGPAVIRRNSSSSSKPRTRRRKRRKRPLWNRIFRAIYQDIRDAHTLLAQTPPKK